MKITAPILFLLLGTTCYAQQLTPKEEVYKILSAHSIFNSPYRETAKKAFEDYLSRYPTNPYRLVATYWLAELFNQSGEIDSAQILHTQVLNMSVPDTVDDANYRRSSAVRLTEIKIDHNEYSAALNYLDVARQKFFPRFGCGNARIEDDMKMKALYSSCYIGQGNYNKAIDSLAPYMFVSWYGENTAVVDKLYEAYLKIYTKQEIKDEFVNATNSLFIKQTQDHSYSFLQPTIRIFRKEIEFHCLDCDLNKLTEQERKQRCIETIKQSAIYKLVNL